VTLDVTHHAVHDEPRILIAEALGAAAQDRLRDVDRHVAFERLGLLHRVEQHARLLGRA
jgi:hypothetical protein